MGNDKPSISNYSIIAGELKPIVNVLFTIITNHNITIINTLIKKR